MGSAILRYTILVRQSNNSTFGPETSFCDGSETLVKSTTSCSIPIYILMSAPYSLTWVSSVFVTVIATNAYGDSNDQLPGNGAVIITNPDPPLNLANIYLNLENIAASTNANQILI